MALLTPTKRVLTEEAHHALRAPISPSSSLISDDLAARLQNVGSRVRKCVNEGYATSRYGLTSSIPPTPFSSPTKVNAESPATSHTVFRTANETLAAVFSSPSGGKTQAPPHTPSPRKRGRRELETDAEEDQRLPVSSANEDTEMDTDAEDVTIITTPTPSPIRPLKPLRKSARPHAPARTPVWHGMTTTSEAMDAIEATNAGTSAVIKDWNDMFTQEF